MDTAKQPNIFAEAVILSASNFNRNPHVDRKIDVNFKFTYKKKKISDDKGHGILSVKVTGKNITDNEPVFELSCSFVGVYRAGSPANMDLDTFLQDFAPAHLLPYIREYISSITLRAGIPPILLPPLNIKAILKTPEKVEGKATDNTIKEFQKKLKK